MKSPRMTGALLRLSARMLESPLTRGMVGMKALKDAGIYRVRKARSSDAPALVPPGIVAAESRQPVDEADLTCLPRAASAPTSTAADLTAAYNSGASTPSAVCETLLAALEEHPNVMTSVKPEEARAQAEASTERWAAGVQLGNLDGVPVVVKDEFDVEGHVSTLGTRFRRSVAEADSTIVARLKQAGAVVVGKANMHEIGIGVTGINPFHGTPHNPHADWHVTGGSSSGSAAAVAGGLVPISLGADGGGSIRIPSSLCGVVGLKPTWGRVSEHGVPDVCWSVAHAGPIGATVRDVALAYSVIAGKDSQDSRTGHQPPPTLAGLDNADLSGLKVGIFRPWFEHADPEIVAACDRAVGELVSAGAEIQDIELSEFELIRPVHLITIVSEMVASQVEQLAQNPREFSAETRLKLGLGRRIIADDYIHAQRLRVRLCRQFTRALEQVDVIATPATASTAPRLRRDALKTGESDLPTTGRLMRFMQPANLTGYPAISIPAGYDSDGLPIGLQLMANAWQEALLIRLASVVEATTERRAPELLTRLLD